MKLVETMRDIDAAHWDALNLASGGNEFLSYAFLSSLEDAECVGWRAGWQMSFVLDGVKGALPLYIKSHSQGEFVFDHVFAQSYARAGGEYYPKMQIASPFSPVSGARLLGDCGDALDFVGNLARNNGISSVHTTFCMQSEQALLVEKGFLARQDNQFHFHNENYRDFQDFLDSLASAKRKNLRKERERAMQGLELEIVSGNEITQNHLNDFYAFYIDTGNRKWGQPYLNRQFFSLLHERMGDKILLIFAKRGNIRVAGAFNIIGQDCLFGRYWGCNEHIPFLHFELSYYQAMDYAIAKKLKVVEAGAQGEHKLVRGYKPITTYSAHYFTHPGLHEAVARYLKHEASQVEHAKGAMEELLPFKTL